MDRGFETNSSQIRLRRGFTVAEIALWDDHRGKSRNFGGSDLFVAIMDLISHTSVVMELDAVYSPG